MPVEQVVTHSAQESLEWAERFAKHLSAGDTIALTGELGAGKTVIAKGIGKGLGVREEILSPTFNYLIEYEGRIPFFHADLYRIADAAHFRALGLEEYWDRHGVLLLEWAERIRELIPDDAIWIQLTRGSSESGRIITMKRP